MFRFSLTTDGFPNVTNDCHKVHGFKTGSSERPWWVTNIEMMFIMFIVLYLVLLKDHYWCKWLIILREDGQPELEQIQGIWRGRGKFYQTSRWVYIFGQHSEKNSMYHYT